MAKKTLIISWMASLVAAAYATTSEDGYGHKLSSKTSSDSSIRGTREVSSLGYGAPPPSTNYGPPGHREFAPFGAGQSHNNFPLNEGQKHNNGGYFQNAGQNDVGGFVPPPAPSHSGTHNQGHYQDQQWPPQPYEFAYTVLDAPSGNDYGHRESGDGAGRVSGEYRVLLPDGRTQIVTYTASDETGYNAQVTYKGEARQDGYYGGSNQGGGFIGGNAGIIGQQQHGSDGYGSPRPPYRK